MTARDWQDAAAAALDAMHDRAVTAESSLAIARHALTEIASCEMRVPGDTVDIARRALVNLIPGVMTGEENDR